MSRLVNQILRKIMPGTLILLSTFFCKGQTDTLHRALLDSTSLSTYDNAITLWESDSLVVITNKGVFENQFHQWIKEHPDLQDDQKLFNALFTSAADKSVDVIRVADDLKLIERLKFRVADFLESGSCFIYNKRTDRLENLIHIAEYSTTGYEGKRFIAATKIILETIERVW